MAALINIAAKCELRSVMRFINAKGELPAEIQKQIFTIYDDFMDRKM
jgi:hypothetical protein